MHHTDPRAGVNFWSDEKNEPILHPKLKEGRRLAAFPCVPNVGCVPNHEAWRGVTLPRHGILRSGEQRGEHYERHTKSASSYNYHFTMNDSDSFPWSYQVKVRIEFRHDANILRYGITVSRSQYCRNKSLMPLALGVSFYIATHGADCAVHNGAAEILHSGRLLRSEGERFRTKLAPLTIKTSAGSLLVSPQSIFDDAELWSREPLSYLNLVVSAGRDEPMLLPRARCAVAWWNSTTSAAERRKYKDLTRASHPARAISLILTLFLYLGPP